MTPQEHLNEAVFYALKEGCFDPVPYPHPSASVRDWVRWGAMRHLHDAIRAFDLARQADPASLEDQPR